MGPVDGPGGRAPGRGKFLVNVQLTSVELSINDTNKLWHEQSRVGRRHLRAVEEVQG